MIKAYAAKEAGASLELIEYDPGELAPGQVEINVEYCGLCHSDISIIDNEWQMSQYPVVPGHEVVGTVSSLGEGVTHLKVGQRVGLGWFSGSCLTCEQCLGGDHNLCASNEHLIVMSKGGFADKVRCQALWAVPIPEGISSESAGPFFCAGATVFNPIIQNGLCATSKVGIVGIGGLGHLAVQFLAAWGCEVTAFSSTDSKKDEVLRLGAKYFIATKDESNLEQAANSLDFILITANVELPWESYIAALKPRGVLHFVGAAPSVSSAVFPLIVGQKTITASPLASPATMARMLEFSERHSVAPHVEVFPMSKVNDAIQKLKNEKPAHRLVLKNDF